jgi:hypothetical protein
MIEYHDPAGGYNSRQNREFERWRNDYGDAGLVVSCRDQKSGMLHRAGCWHFTFKPDEKVKLVKNKKICFNTPRDYESWERSSRRLTVSRCAHCKP